MKKNFGFIIGCDSKVEWLLPLFWLNFRFHNNQPITLYDFGISDDAKKWCQARFPVVSIKKHLGENLDAELGKIHPYFKKPFACHLSPYKKSVWLDLDTIVRADLSHLEHIALNESKIAMLEEPPAHVKELEKVFFLDDRRFPIYNSGVMVFEKTSPLLAEWINYVLSHRESFRGDQEMLSYLLFQKKWIPSPIDKLDNWLIGIFKAPPEKTRVVHYSGMYKLFQIKMIQILQLHNASFNAFPTFSTPLTGDEKRILTVSIYPDTVNLMDNFSNFMTQ